jgi:hypothetical protein
MRPHTLIACAALAATATLNAQSFTTHPCGNNSDDRGALARLFTGAEQACETRSTTFPLVAGHLKVSSQNGGIEVIGEDRPDIALEARVSARANSQSDAAGILHDITIDTGSTVVAHGPKPSTSRNWSVSYKLHVPHHLAAQLETLNGSLALTSIEGSIHGETTNGALTIDHLAGDIQVTTTNGAIHANLDGPTWQGSRLNLSTTNGAVSVALPANYSAHLEASTTNGGISFNHAGADSSGVHHHSIDTNLGSGGPTISFETTNGSISIQ